MTAMLTQFIRTASEDGLQVNIWPREVGFQINVKEAGASGWTIVTDDDPVNGLETALRQRLSRSSARKVVSEPEPAQIDLEDVIAKVTQQTRYLLWHPGSGSLWEDDHFDIADGLVEDVTGIKEYEDRFAAAAAPDPLDDLIG